MKARIYLASEGGDHACDGTDYEFEALPKVGEVIRLTGHRPGHFTVTEIAHVQEGDRFLVAVFAGVNDDSFVADWVASYDARRPG